MNNSNIPAWILTILFNQQFGKSKISLVSTYDIRYKGILYSVDAVKSTITLTKVHSFGTEDRRTPVFVPPREEMYQFIVFKANDIKDLLVCETAKSANSESHGLTYDPAIVSISKNLASEKNNPSQRPKQSTANEFPTINEKPSPRSMHSWLQNLHTGVGSEGFCEQVSDYLVDTVGGITKQNAFVRENSIRSQSASASAAPSSDAAFLDRHQKKLAAHPAMGNGAQKLLSLLQQIGITNQKVDISDCDLNEQIVQRQEKLLRWQEELEKRGQELNKGKQELEKEKQELNKLKVLRLERKELHQRNEEQMRQRRKEQQKQEGARIATQTQLKSCLKKGGQPRSGLGLRVYFCSNCCGGSNFHSSDPYSSTIAPASPLSNITNF